MSKIISKIFAYFAAAVMTVSAAAVPVSAADSSKLPATESMVFVNSLGAGWNLGNAFDAIDCTWLTNKLDYEMGWCGVRTSKDIVKAVKNAGFSTVRIPVSWHNHIDNSNNIDSMWLNRVKEVVDWCLAEDMHVILNIHHDNNTGFYPSKEKLDESITYVKQIWRQIAMTFKDYGDEVIFESLNEPRLTDHKYEWWWPDSLPAEVKESIECINKLHQAMLDTVRASGGYNKTRYLMFVGYAGMSTSIKGVNEGGGVLSPYFALPTDTVDDRIIVDCHYYGEGKEKGHAVIDGLYEKFTSKGIPVAITEYGLSESRTAYSDIDATAAKEMGEFASYAREHGITVFVWDDNGNLKLLDRATVKWVAPNIVAALVSGGEPLKMSAFYHPEDLNDDKKEAAGTASQTVSDSKSDSSSGTSDKTAVKTDTVSSKPKVTAKAYKNKVKLSWTKVDGASKYRVYMKNSNGKYAKVKAVKGTSATVTGLKAGKTYKFIIRAYVNGKWTTMTTKDVVSVKTKTK